MTVKRSTNDAPHREHLTVRSLYSAGASNSASHRGHSTIGIARAPSGNRLPACGNIVDFLFVFAQPAQGALSAHTFGIAVGYLLFAGVFAAFGWWVARRPPVQDPGQRAAEHDNALRPGEPPA